MAAPCSGRPYSEAVRGMRPWDHPVGPPGPILALPHPPVPVVSPAPADLDGGTQLAQLKMKVTGKRGARYPGRPATSPDELSLDELDETVENRTA